MARAAAIPSHSQPIPSHEGAIPTGPQEGGRKEAGRRRPPPSCLSHHPSFLRADDDCWTPLVPHSWCKLHQWPFARNVMLCRRVCGVLSYGPERQEGGRREAGRRRPPPSCLSHHPSFLRADDDCWTPLVPHSWCKLHQWPFARNVMLCRRVCVNTTGHTGTLSTL